MDLLCSVLLHSAKTQKFLKRLKKEQPDKWQRVYGNISMAYHLLAPRQVKVKKYLIGVFDPDVDFSWPWPWHCHYEDGIYLRGKHRLCKRGKAVLCESAEAAREFFHQWKGKKSYKMELIEVETIKWVEPD